MDTRLVRREEIGRRRIKGVKGSNGQVSWKYVQSGIDSGIVTKQNHEVIHLDDSEKTEVGIMIVMSPTKRYCLTVTSLVLTCSGCTIPTIQEPLVNPSESKPFPKLHGAYRTTDCPDNIVHYAHVGPAGDNYPDGFLPIISVSQPKNAETLEKGQSQSLPIPTNSRNSSNVTLMVNCSTRQSGDSLA